MAGGAFVFKFILFYFFVALLGTCFGELESLDDLNNAVASFAKSSLEELAGVEDDFEPIIGTIQYNSGKTLVSISGSLRDFEVRGIGGISNVSVQVNLGAKGTESEQQMIVSMEILGSSVRGIHNLQGFIGNSILLGNPINNNSWNIYLAAITLCCHPKIFVENGHIKLGDCVPNSLISTQGAIIDFPGLVNDPRVDPDMLEGLKAIILERATSSGLQDLVGQSLYKKIIAHLQNKFDEVKLLDMVGVMGNKKPKVKSGRTIGFEGQGQGHAAAPNALSERMAEYARQIITNFTRTTPDPTPYPYNVTLSFNSPLVNITGNLSRIGFHGLARDFRFNLSADAVAENYNSVQVSINIFDAELNGEYNLEGWIAGEKEFGGQGSWSIKNISVIHYVFEPRVELEGFYFKQWGTGQGGFRMELIGSELRMPGLLDNVDVTETVRKGVMDILRPQIISLMNTRLSHDMQMLIAQEIYRKFEAIPAVSIFTI